MRNYNSVFHLQNTLTGVITASSSVAATLQGEPIDTIGFQDMLGILCCGSVMGSGAAPAADLTVKFQEGATAASTGSDFADIKTGAINGTASVYGSAKFDVVQVAAGSAMFIEPMQKRKLYLLLNQDGQKRYIRAHASVTGTTGGIVQTAISVSILLGRARESTYIIDAVSMATASADVQNGWTSGSVPVLA